MSVVTKSNPELMARAELNRFSSILRRHIEASGSDRRRLREVLIEYLKFSQNFDQLAERLISTCIGLGSSERFDVPIDILSQTGKRIQDYTFEYLLNDINAWSNLYPKENFRPNSDYWYVLLRSVARCSGDKQISLLILSTCQDVAPRQVMEAIVEGLADLETDQAKALLQNIKDTHPDDFIKSLADETLRSIN